MEIGQKLYDRSVALINEKIRELESADKEAQRAANNETKSSAGDKYETGRAMMHLEKERIASQMTNWLKLLKAIKQVDPQKNRSLGRVGKRDEDYVGELLSHRFFGGDYH